MSEIGTTSYSLFGLRRRYFGVDNADVNKTKQSISCARVCKRHVCETLPATS